jgi:hypothetical protein
VLRGAVAIADAGDSDRSRSERSPANSASKPMSVYDCVANNEILDCIVDFVFSEIE